MAKTSGLGQKFYYGGGGVYTYDLSGDVGSVDNCHGGPALLDVTSIDKSAHERIGGRRDGSIEYSAFFNPATLADHEVLSTLPTTDVMALWLSSTTAGQPVAACLGKMTNYPGARGADGSFTFKPNVMANGYGLEWCILYRALSTDASAASGTGIDGGTYGSAVTITSGSAASPTVVTATGHGLVTGDSITISGTDKAALNISTTVTVTGVNTFTVPVDLSGGAATGGTFLKTSTNFGASAYIWASSLASGTPTPVIQDSPDNTTFVAIAGMTFSALTTGPTNFYQRVQSASTLPIRRYVRFVTTGTFTNLVWAAAAIRHTAATL